MHENSQPDGSPEKKLPVKNYKKSGIQQANLQDLKPHPKNPRVIKDAKYQALVQSLKTFPEMLQARPLICIPDEENPGKLLVIGGNMRLRGAQELKFKTIPVTVVQDWTPEMVKQFMIRDNVNNGEWDYATLVTDWSGTELEDWGLENVNFNPNLGPSFSASNVTRDDIDKTDQQLKIRMRNVQTFVDCICPACGHEYQLSSGDVPDSPIVNNKPSH